VALPVSALSVNVAGGRFTLADILEEPSYRRLWASGLCMSVARWMDLVTLGWLSFQLTGSPFMVGLAAFARSAPMMLIGPFAGIVADRVPRGRVLVISQTTGIVTALLLAAIFATGHGGYWPLLALEVVFGLVWALDFPARRTALYAVLGAPRVAQAVSLETVSMQIAKMLGPLAAGVCLARVGPSASFGIMAVIYMVGLLASRPLGARLGGPSGAAAASLAATIRAGLSAAWASHTVRAVLLVTVAMNTLFFPYQHMMPVFARTILEVGPVGLGALVAADGCGALLGALVIAARRGGLGHRVMFGAASLAAPLLLVALSGSRRLVLCAGLLVVMGAAESAYAAMQSTLVLLSAPERLRGGVMGILSACIGTQPLGTLAIGLLAGAAGVPAAFTVNAIAALVVIVPLALPLLRGRPD
jgi:MFS family permease